MAKAKATINDKIKKRPKVERGPLWTGPNGEGPNGGVTQGLIGRFLVCRERFRLHAMEGLRPADKFNSVIEFGNMWHVCEEVFAHTPIHPSHKVKSDNQWTKALVTYADGLDKRYPLQRTEIMLLAEKCATMFPLYVKHWEKHPDMIARTPLLQEQAFDVPYKLPSGRIVRLRGKWDSVDLVGSGKSAGIWLQENKTKSAIDTVKITRQLKFDLQTMLYLIALGTFNDEVFWQKAREAAPGQGRKPPILGVRYNCVRRSAHKSVESMLKKIEEDREDGRIGEWFSRFNVEVSAADVQRFRRECLNPILENLCWWHEWETGQHQDDALEDWKVPPHSWRHPFGIYNVLDEGGSSDLDTHLETGSLAGLRRTEVLFPELT